MSSHTWSLEAELTSLAGEPIDQVAAALVNLGLAPSGTSDLGLDVDLDWHRSGSETYQFHFSVISGAVHIGRYVLKSCIALGGLQGTAEILDDWLVRRRLLESNGVQCPILYGHQSSTILEEWVPLSLGDSIANASTVNRRHLLRRLGHLAGTLTRLGFPAMVLTDLRSRATDVVVVDFGEDLGPSGLATRDHSAILEQVMDFAESIVDLAKNDLESLAGGFDLGLQT